MGGRAVSAQPYYETEGVKLKFQDDSIVEIARLYIVRHPRQRAAPPRRVEVRKVFFRQRLETGLARKRALARQTNAPAS